jgi:molybdenum cofactor cytidylyltransferase
MAFPVSVIIAAAGSSTRMGQHKALLTHNSGVSFARHLLDTYKKHGCGPVILVVGPDLDQTSLMPGSHQLVENHQPEQGRSHSIFLGLQLVPSGSACFIQNVDNPFLSEELLDSLVENMMHDGYNVPVHQGRGGHPILLGRDVVASMKSKERLTDFRELLQKFKRVETTWPDAGVLWNINLPEDYSKYLFTMK